MKTSPTDRKRFYTYAAEYWVTWCWFACKFDAASTVSRIIKLLLGRLRSRMPYAYYNTKNV